MKSAILISPGVLEITHKAPVPVPGPGEVVVKVRTALTCGTDLKAFLRGHPKIPMPSPLGHEFSGDVHAVGEGVEGFAAGDAVMAVHSAPCGACRHCRDGRENLCETAMNSKVLGAYAEYLKLPAPVVSLNMFKKPEGLGYAEAAMLEPLACVVHGNEVVSSRRIDSVLVVGAGPIGLMHLMVNKAAGRKVIVAGRNSARLEIARSFGADAVVDAGLDEMAWQVIEATDGMGADLVIEATGAKEVWEAAPRFVRRGGTVLLFGGCPSGVAACFDTDRLHYDEITLVGAFHFTPADVRKAYGLLTEGTVKTGGMVTAEYPLERLEDAFRRLEAGVGIKYAIIP